MGLSGFGEPDVGVDGEFEGVGALELGLTMAVDAMKGRLRLTGDYDFQRIARTTGSGPGKADVPIQQALARVGLAVAL